MTIAQRIGAVHANMETLTKAREFCALARAIALGRGNHGAVSAEACREFLAERFEELNVFCFLTSELK